MQSPLMDYTSYILLAYGLAALLIGGLILHTWVAAHRASRALAKRDRA